jgi:hypothetical protein
VRNFPIDSARLTAFSTGVVAPVQKWIELSDGSRKPDPAGRQDEDEHGRPLWRVEAILPADAEDERDKTSVTEIVIASKDRPDAGNFGEPLAFVDLTMSPGFLSKKTGQVGAPRWTASGIRPRHAQPKPQAA